MYYRFISQCEDEEREQNIVSSTSSSQCQAEEGVHNIVPSTSSSKRKRNEEVEKNVKTKWIIKSPYSGNMLHFKYSVHDSAGAIQYFTKTVLPKMDQGICYKLPYLIFQKKLADAREAKLCFFNKSFRHFCSGILVILVI
jgi:hypothetical protein